MKKLMIAFIITFATIAVGLVCFMVYAVNVGSVGTFEYSNMELVNTQEISLDEIDSIAISYQSEDVKFYESDTDQLIFKEYMNYKPKDNELSRITKSGNELTIESGKQKLRFFSFWIFSNNSRVEIYLPAGYSDKLTVDTSSGNIVSDLALTLTEFEAKSSSGDIRVNEVYADRISATASSGNISFQVAEGKRQFKASSGNIKVFGGTGDSDVITSSGNITIENALGHIETEASSGNINIIDSVGGGNLETTSGNIKLDLTAVTENLTINASSGNVSVKLPNTTSFDFSSETSSGEIRTFFDDELSYNKKGNVATGMIGDNPDIDIDIATSSGNIRITD